MEDGQAWFDTLGTEVITNTVSFDGFTMSQRPTGYRITTLKFGETDE